MENLKTICNTVAARYLALATPSGAAEAMKATYGQSPVAVPNTPAVYIEVVNGDTLAGAGVYANTHHLIAHFLLAKKSGDTARVETQRQIWLPSLINTLISSTWALGLAAPIKSILPTGYEFVETTVAADTFDGIDIFLDVECRDMTFAA